MTRKGTTGGFGAGTLMSSFLRCYLVGAGFNTMGMQNLGLAFAMDPGLRAIYGDRPELADARARYLKHYNTHPFWTPLLVGVFLTLERDIARGVIPAETLDSVKSTTIYTLSAIGDSFFGGSLLAFWALVTICLTASGNHAAAVVLGGVFFAGLQCFKLLTFMAGFREGFKILPRLRKFDLVNWGRRLKYINALLLLLFWVLIWPGTLEWRGWLAGTLAMSISALAVRRLSLPREIVAAALLLGYMALPVLSDLLAGLGFESLF